MGDDPATSVVDSHGRAHDHENLFVVGAPTSVSGGCANATLTFLAVALRQATAIGKDFGERRTRTRRRREPAGTGNGESGTGAPMTPAWLARSRRAFDAAGFAFLIATFAAGLQLAPKHT